MSNYSFILNRDTITRYSNEWRVESIKRCITFEELVHVGAIVSVSKLKSASNCRKSPFQFISIDMG